MQVYRLFKVWVWLIGSFYATCHLINGAIIAERETTPTPITLEDFARDYQGQHWLSLTGHLDLDRAFVRPANNNRCEVWAPMSSWNADPSQPVHVYALLGPFDRDQMDAKLAQYRSPQITLTGSQVYFDADRVLPGVPHADPIIMVQEGNKPISANGSWGGAALFGTIFLLLLWLQVVRPIRNALSQAPPPDQLIGATIK
jgi:hypothetical protein